MTLCDRDLASVPAEHLVALASCATFRVDIIRVRNCDLVSILDNIKCRQCGIYDQSLNREESLALVRVMESRVERVELGFDGIMLCRGDLSLDIQALTQYSGEGRCWSVEYFCVGADRYREEVRSWAQSINWDVTQDDSYTMLEDDRLEAEEGYHQAENGYYYRSKNVITIERRYR